jgi:hypothetical protein
MLFFLSAKNTFVSPAGIKTKHVVISVAAIQAAGEVLSRTADHPPGSQTTEG